MQLIIAILAAWRLTELMTIDRISEPIRRRWPWYIWTCQRCVSVWAGIVATAAFIYLPILNMPLALSSIYIIGGAVVARLIEKPQQEKPQPSVDAIVIEVHKPTGRFWLKQSSLNAEDTVAVLKETAGMIYQQNKSNGTISKTRL